MYHFWYKYQNWYVGNTRNGTRKIPKVVHEYQKWYMRKKEIYQKWYMKNSLNTKSGIWIPKMVYAKAEEIPEMVHIYYGIKTK